MPPKRANLIPAVPPPGEDDARREWPIKYRSSFTTRWGVQGGFVNKVVPVRWAVSRLVSGYTIGRLIGRVHNSGRLRYGG
jgi:hypothetical protein